MNESNRPGKRSIAAYRMVRDMQRKKLLALLSQANDFGFLQMLWATYVLQSDEPAPARPYLTHPNEVETGGEYSPHSVHPWELDTLATLVLTTDKAKLRPKKNRYLKTGVWNAVLQVVGLLRRLENAESGITVNGDTIQQEMSRIAQRQFHWHRSYFHPEGIRRALFVYGHDDAKAYFQQKYGMTLDEFTMASIMLSVEYRLHRGL